MVPPATTAPLLPVLTLFLSCFHPDLGKFPASNTLKCFVLKYFILEKNPGLIKWTAQSVLRKRQNMPIYTKRSFVCLSSFSSCYASHIHRFPPPPTHRPHYIHAQIISKKYRPNFFYHAIIYAYMPDHCLTQWPNDEAINAYKHTFKGFM